jgi:hypothetical protein
VKTKAWINPINIPKKTYKKGGIIMLYKRFETTSMIIAPPIIFPYKRKDMDTTLAISPIKFKGAIKNIGSKYSPIYFLNPFALIPEQ